MVESGGERGEFRGPGAFLGVGKPGTNSPKLLGRLALSGEFVGVLESEKRGASADTRAFGHGEGFELAREGRSNVNEIAFKIALITNGAGARTSGEDECGAG